MPVPLHSLQHMFVVSCVLSYMVLTFVISSFSALQLQERGQHVSQHPFTVRTCRPHVPSQTHSFTYAFHRAELVGMNSCHTYGYIDRINLCIGAFFNGVFLLALALSICLQSIERFVHVEVVNSPKLVLIIGCIGLGLNIISAIVVHGKRQLVGGCDSRHVKI